MDKELLRAVIILIGLLVMIGMVLWHFLKSLRDNRVEDYGDDEAYEDRPYQVDEDDDEFDIVPGKDFVDGDAILDDDSIRPSPRFDDDFASANKSAPKAGIELPQLIEFSVVARSEEGFNGEALFDALEKQGLVYGDVKVFERLDANRMVDFTVASMIKPGTFPEYGLDEYYCPGIVFYLQPRELENPLVVFDDFMDTIDSLADELDGSVLDNQKRPLTADTVEHFRQLFAR